MKKTFRFASRLTLTALLAAGLCAPISAQPLRDGAVLKTVDVPESQIKIFKVHQAARRTTSFGGSPVFDGDTYSFQAQLGALIDQVFQCFSNHTAGMDDNTVLFDGLSELLDPYLDGTQPLVFEFETPSNDTPGATDSTINAFSDGDLFPEGFQDPETGTPLDSACVEIGIDDTLDSDIPSEVSNAMISFSSSGGTVLPPTDITSFFENPWDGRLSIVFTGLTGQDIADVQLQLVTQAAPDPSTIFADGFESGDATAWQ